VDEGASKDRKERGENADKAAEGRAIIVAGDNPLDRTPSGQPHLRSAITIEDVGLRTDKRTHITGAQDRVAGHPGGGEAVQ